MRLAGEMPSASAWKFSTMRWPSTGSAIAWTSSISGIARPSIAARAFAAVPTWVWSAYAIAVWVATAAAISLLLRRKLAVTLYALSLAAVLVQFSWTFFVDTVIQEKGAAAAFLPVTIIVLAVFSLWYARRKASQGVLR